MRGLEGNTGASLVAASLLLTNFACGSRSEFSDPGAGTSRTPSSCIVPASPFYAVDAVRIARCQPEIPTTARFSGIISRYGVDSAGASFNWGLSFREKTIAYETRITQESINVEIQSSWKDCVSPDLIPLRTDIVVPDALKRYAAFGFDLNPDDAVVRTQFYQRAFCPPRDAISNRVIIVRIPDDMPFDGTGQLFWDVYYDDAGGFIKVCGPCERPGDPACSPCRS